MVCCRVNEWLGFGIPRNLAAGFPIQQLLLGMDMLESGVKSVLSPTSTMIFLVTAITNQNLGEPMRTTKLPAAFGF
jgi:hypothetical protein